jgi:hypothetical protein
VLIKRRKNFVKQNWQALSFDEKYALFNKWSVVSLVGNLLTIFGSIFYLLNDMFTLIQAEHFLGFGCFFTWLSITRYFQNTQDYYLITRTFNVAIPVVIRVTIGWFPVFVAYGLLGLCLFWPYRDYFDTVSNSMMILFAMMHGDSVGDVFTGVGQTRLLLGQIYVYSWAMLSILLFQNLSTIIVEDSFLTAKYTKNFDWLTGKISAPAAAAEEEQQQR